MSHPFSQPPFSEINADSVNPCLFICEHASNYIPNELNNLGLPPHLIEEHIAWDIGVRNLVAHLTKKTGNTAVLSEYSRLLVDCNRPIHEPSCIPTHSEVYSIPGNENLSHHEKAARIENIYQPFHSRVEHHVERLLNHHNEFPVIGIHSFTPTYQDETRPWQFSVMWDQEPHYIRCLLDYLRKSEIRDLIGFNQPYSIKGVNAYTYDNCATKYGLPAFIFEVRQDCLVHDDQVAHWGDFISEVISLINRY